MTPEALAHIGDLIVGAGVNYQLGSFRYDGPAPKYPYYVGTYNEADGGQEDGSSAATLTINGWTRGAWLELEQGKAKIKRLFPAAGGYTAILEHSGLAVSYARSHQIPSGDPELKRIEITLHVQEWSE